MRKFFGVCFVAVVFLTACGPELVVPSIADDVSNEQPNGIPSVDGDDVWAEDDAASTERPAECDSDSDCAPGFGCNVENWQCEPNKCDGPWGCLEHDTAEYEEPDVVSDDDVATVEDVVEDVETECPCEVGYVCYDNQCVEIPDEPDVVEEVEPADVVEDASECPCDYGQICVNNECVDLPDEPDVVEEVEPEPDVVEEVAPEPECAANSDCDDSNACTEDVCASGACNFLPIYGCEVCQDVSDCADVGDNICVQVACEAGVCTYSPDFPCAECQSNEDCGVGGGCGCNDENTKTCAGNTGICDFGFCKIEIVDTLCDFGCNSQLGDCFECSEDTDCEVGETCIDGECTIVIEGCDEDAECDDSDPETYDACILGECISESYDGDVLCEVICPAQYEQVRVWWAFTDQDVLSGQLIVLSETEMCEWGEVAFEFNCFTPNGPWGGYSEAEVECWSPYGYEVTENTETNHGKVVFSKSCW